MSDELIIEHCSPTLAGIKTGSLFSVRVNPKEDIDSEVRKLNDMLREKGLRIIPLKKTDKYVLLYLYRPDRLKKDLKDPKALCILRMKGYKPESPECCIVQLADHLKNDDSFPHEIGLFLGYPPSDVEGFMKNPFKGVQCCGCWKAYSEPEKAKRTFNRFSTCTKVYHEMNRKGRSLAQLVVAHAE